MTTTTTFRQRRTSGSGPSDGSAIGPLDVEDLLLDQLNPRLPETMATASHEELLAFIVKRFSITDLIESLAANGYFDEEPLVVVPSSRKGKYTVVEGNRRLAALLVLLDGELAKRFHISVPKLTQQRRTGLTKVPVRIRHSRAEVLPYLGYRHITGVMQWDSYSKARFVSQLVKEGHDLKRIQRDIGDRHQTAPRLYRTYLVWQEAEFHGYISENGTTPNFTYLFTALTFRPVMIFLGLSNQGKPRAVRRSHLPQLRELTAYLYGSKKRKPAIAESREIKDLAQALTNERSHAQLKRGATVEEALEAMPGQQARLEQLLSRAADALSEAVALAPQHKKNTTLRELAERCSQIAKKLERAFSID